MRLRFSTPIAGLVVAIVCMASNVYAAPSPRQLVPSIGDLRTLQRTFGAKVLTAATFRTTKADSISAQKNATDGHVSIKEVIRDSYRSAYEIQFTNRAEAQPVRMVGGEVIQLATTAGAHRFLTHVVFSPFVRGELTGFRVKIEQGPVQLGSDSKLLVFGKTAKSETDIITWRRGTTLARVSVLGPPSEITQRVMLGEVALMDARIRQGH